MIILRKDKTKGNVSFPHYRWQKEENTSLIRDVLSCLNGSNSYTDGMGYTNRNWFYCFILVCFQCKKRCSSRDSLNTVQAGEAVLNVMNLCCRSTLFFLWREGPKCLSQPTQEGEGSTVVLTPFFLSLPADKFHWAQSSHHSKLKLKKTQQQGKVPSSHSTDPLQRDIFDNSVSLFPN